MVKGWPSSVGEGLVEFRWAPRPDPDASPSPLATRTRTHRSGQNAREWDRKVESPSVPSESVEKPAPVAELLHFGV